jgi:DNA-binding HxlR family transcriptional regulator
MAVPKSPVGCPMDSLLRLLMGPWTTYILWVLRSNGPTRFGELKRKVAGVSAKVLSERLRMLAEASVVHRQFEATIPPQVTYSLTVRGEELREVLDRLNEVAVRWQTADKAAAAAAPAALGHSAGPIDPPTAGVAVAAAPASAG